MPSIAAERGRTRVPAAMLPSEIALCICAAVCAVSFSGFDGDRSTPFDDIIRGGELETLFTTGLLVAIAP